MADACVLATSKRREVTLDNTHLNAFELLKQRYTVGRAWRVPTFFDEKPVVILTDGACEEVKGKLLATVGGLLFDPSSDSPPQAFGCVVSDRVLNAWLDAGKVLPVPQTEVSAVVLARHIWGDFRAARRCIFYIDS